MDNSRRNFLQTTAVGAAGVVLSSSVNTILAAESSTSAWTNGMQINPSIDNKRVVCCTDVTMFTSTSAATSATTFANQNAAVVSARVETNLDAMAISLSGKTTVTEAWNTIFRKPDAKEWNAVKVAIKVNCINASIMPRISIVAKICKELIRIGVMGSNITVYDACHDASGNSKYSQYIGKALPSGVAVQSGKGSTSNVTVGTSTNSCTQVVINCDILINCAVNKGHSQTDKGGFTLSMKNHTGTMKFSCPSLTEMINQNKSDAIIGGTPPKQQLCIVDSLWAAVSGPMDEADSIPAKIVMGTFGPLVDIAVAKNIRETVMKATHNQTAINTILSSFGYSLSDIQWVDVPPATAVSHKIEHLDRKKFSVAVNVNGFQSAFVNLQIPDLKQNFELNLLTIDGKLVAKTTVTETTTLYKWHIDNFLTIAQGEYILFANSDNFSAAQAFKLQR